MSIVQTAQADGALLGIARLEHPRQQIPGVGRQHRKFTGGEAISNLLQRTWGRVLGMNADSVGHRPLWVTVGRPETGGGAWQVVCGALIMPGPEPFEHLPSMWYLILGRDADGALPKRLANRPAHLERLRHLHDAGRLLLAGPLPAIDAEDPGPAGFVGSAIIAEFDCLADASRWAEDDPYRTAGVYASVEVLPFRKVLP